MRTIAQEIAEIKQFADALEAADKVAIDREQDWDNETTIFKFDDGSKVKACFPFVEVVE